MLSVRSGEGAAHTLNFSWYCGSVPGRNNLENKGRKAFLWLVVPEEFPLVTEAYHYSATQEAQRKPEPSDAFP